MGVLGRTTCVASVLVAATFCYADHVAFIPAHTVDGSLDAQARLETVHAAMLRQCAVSPASARCERLKREFQQEAKIAQKRRRK